MKARVAWQELCLFVVLIAVACTWHAQENPLRTPTHVMYSHVDPVTDSDRIESVMANWQSKGIPVTSSVFDESEHVQVCV